MFGLPNAKRVRRIELHDRISPAASASDDAVGPSHALSAEEITARTAQLGKLLDLEVVEYPTSSIADLKPSQDEDDQVFEFRLFGSASGSTPAAPQRIILPSATAEAQALKGDGAIVKTRPPAFYLASPPTSPERQQFEDIAVSAEDILSTSQKRAWGLEVPWRITKLIVGSPAAKKQGKETADMSGEEDKVVKDSKRRRPGKKRRIALRIKIKAEQDKEATKMAKEEHQKAKKVRLNRARKLKRKQKEKNKKAAASGSSGGTENSALPEAT